MKKITTLFLGLTCMLSVNAQEYNLFHDVDADGWLWFDTQEKIDKYIGICDEENYKVDPNGKPIQMIYADINPDYPSTVADPLFIGVGEDGEFGSAGSRTGAIITAPSSANMTPNGGGFVVLMPSCSTYSMFLSCEGRALVRMMASKNVDTPFTNYDVIKVYATLFKPLFNSGTYTWTGIEKLNNGYEDGYSLEGDEPVYAYLQSATTEKIYIHGIRVTTPTNSTLNINETVGSNAHIFFEGNRVVLNEPADIKVYNTNGLLMNEATNTTRMDLSNMPKGIYIVKANNAVRKFAVQ